MLECKKCHVRIFESNAHEEHGDLIIACSHCGAKNILAPVVFSKVVLPTFDVIGWRD
jgi:hypothetical protein